MLVKSDRDKKSLKIKTVKWSSHGLNGLKPDQEKNYCGMIFWDAGTFKWKEEIKPGFAILADISTLDFQSHENVCQPHRPMCR